MRIKRIVILLWLPIILLNMVLLSNVGAQENSAQFLSEASYEYGRAMHFRLTAAMDEPVDSVTLFIQPQQSDTVFTIELYSSSAEQLLVEHSIDLSQGIIAPFREIDYWWTVQTPGLDFEVPTQTLLYEDNRLSWQTMTQDGVTAHWVGNGPFFGQSALDITAATMPTLAKLLPVQGLVPFDLYIYPSAAELNEALRIAGVEGGGKVAPELDVLLVSDAGPAPAAALTQNIPYGVAQVLMHQFAGSAYEQLPHWLVEGVALTMQPVENPMFNSSLATAVLTQTTIPLAELCYSWPNDPEQALLAEAQSMAFVNFIREGEGDTAVADLFTAYVQGAGCQEGVSQVLSLPLDDLDRAWVDSEQPRSPWAQFAEKYGVWLLLLLAGFGITGLLIRQSR